MPVITSSKTQSTYDVIVVGSGAGGGQAAYTLAMAGVKVLIVEAGRNYDPLEETPMFNLPKNAPLRGKEMEIDNPPPMRLAALTRPPSVSTLRRTIQRPSPACPEGGALWSSSGRDEK